jgi:ABC-type transporter Mla subunit MlaD
MLQTLTGEMTGTIDALRRQAEASGEATRSHQQQISEEARHAVEGLAGEVRRQTQAIEQATSAMRGAVADLGASTARNVQAVGDSAAKMTEAADEFTRSGAGLSDMFHKAGIVTGHMAQVADVLRAASTHVSEIIADYRAARKDFETIVAMLRDTVADAQRHASMTGPALEKIGQAAEKLRHAQDAADAYLTKLNQALVEAHQLFSTNMQKTVREANKTFHQELTHTTQLISAVAADLEDVLSTVNARRQ